MRRVPAWTLVLGGLAAATWGQAPLGPEFQVNTSTAGSQDEPSVAVDAAGNFVVGYHQSIDPGYGFAFHSIVFRQYRPGASPAVSVVAYEEYGPSLILGQVATNASGRFVVVWMEYSFNPYGPPPPPSSAVFARPYDTSGTPLAPAFRVDPSVDPGVPPQWSGRAAMDDSGHFMVAWVESGDVIGRLFDAAGAPLGDRFQVSSTAVDPFRVDVAADAVGNFVLVWTGSGEGDARGVFARRYDGTGQPLSGELHVNSYTTGWQYQPSVAVDPTGSFVVAWTSFPNFGSPSQDGSGAGIFAQRFDALGLTVGSEFQVNALTAFDQSAASVASDRRGSFVIAWESREHDGSQSGVFARRLETTGTMGPELLVNSYTTGWQVQASVGAMPGGQFVVTWTSWEQDGVFGRRFGIDLIFGDGFE